MTLKGHYALCFKIRSSFGAHHENLNEDRLYNQWYDDVANDSRFWQYKVYADIRGGSLETRRETTKGQSKTSIFRSLERYIFGTLGNEANIITGCAVAQHCCKGDQPFQWETPKFAPPYISNPLIF